MADDGWQGAVVVAHDVVAFLEGGFVVFVGDSGYQIVDNRSAGVGACLHFLQAAQTPFIVG